MTFVAMEKRKRKRIRRKQMNELKNWTNVTKGQYRYVI